MLFWILWIFNGIPLSSQPVWESISGYYSTGGAFLDVNQDGYPDLSVANGNDMAAQPNHVFLNQNGTLDTFPSWSSQDAQYSGHLAVGDLNQDGWADLVVANYSGYPVGWPPQMSVVYLNEGGTLSTEPSWIPADSFRSFACALGDYDNDGDLDVVFAAGERYSQHPDVLRLYKNLTQEPDTGLLTQTPVWTSAEAYNAYDVTFVDLNRDGWLDLVVAVDGGPNMVFLNQQGTFPTGPSWTSSDANGTIQIAVADVDRDGWPDLATADNGQLGGLSRFRLYRNLGGTLESQASWVSGESRTYCSTVAFADLNADGYPDLAAGGWWEPVAVYENQQGTLTSFATWSYLTPSPNDLVCEALTFADVDLGALRIVEETLQVTNGHPPYGAWPLSHFPIHAVMEVLGGDPQTSSWDTLSRSAWTAISEEGWITIANLGQQYSAYRIRYKYSPAVDLVVTNWAPNRGNFLFENTLVAVIEDESTPISPIVQISPNPTRGMWIIRSRTPFPEVSLYDASGRSVRIEVQRLGSARFRVTIPPSQSPGVYYLRVRERNRVFWAPVIVVR